MAYVRDRVLHADAARAATPPTPMPVLGAGPPPSSPPDAFAEGLDYARLGQTRRLNLETGAVRGIVQGRSFHSYETSLEFAPYSAEAWDAIARSMGEQARYTAKLLAGELPAELEELFVRLGLNLFPSGADEVRTACTCRHPSPTWCKHAACLSYLLADRLTQDPFLIFTLRGKPAQDLIDHLRHRRSAWGAGEGSTPVHIQVVAGASDASMPALAEVPAAEFWDCPADPRAISMPVAPPLVSHPLLRRLGPSPFSQGKFPLVGLLASCYERISETVLREEREGGTTFPAAPHAATDDEAAA